MILKYRKLHPDAKICKKSYEGDAGFDICSLEEVFIRPKTSAEVKTGLVLEIPKHHHGVLKTKSGMGVRGNLRIHEGIIDEGYRGELTIKIFNLGDKCYHVSKGDRVAQLIVYETKNIKLQEVDFLNPSQRGVKGLGSTGR